MRRSESDKNVRAGTLTGLVCGTLLFLALVISWTPPLPAEPPVDTGMEVNLGDGDLGTGEEAPLSPLPPGPSADDTEVKAPKVPDAPADPPRQVETDDNDREAPEVVAPKPDRKADPKPKPVTPPKEAPRPTPRPRQQPVDLPRPDPAPKPKILYRGGGSDPRGGNESDSWNDSKGQGVKGGRGDQGRPGGDPDADNYKGDGGGRSGISIQKGLAGRRITRFPSFEDEFNENAKVAVDIRVDAEGRVTSAVFQPRGSTTNDASMRTIAVNKALQLRFNGQPGGPENDLGTIIFNFRVR